jgi:hypothetical protein
MADVDERLFMPWSARKIRLVEITPDVYALSISPMGDSAFSTAPITDSVTVTIADGQSLSDAAAIADYRLVGLIVGTWTSAAITFQVSQDGNTYYNLYDDAGNEVTIPAGTHNKAYAAPMELAPWRYMKVRSGTAASPVAQAGGDTVVVAIKS